jgi:hypothetical protein
VSSVPAVYAVTPNRGIPGQEIEITGIYLGPDEFEASVTINSVECEVVNWSDTSITCKIPKTTSGDLIVTNKANNVKGYGATGDGATDDTDDIQEAADDLPL